LIVRRILLGGPNEILNNCQARWCPLRSRRQTFWRWKDYLLKEKRQISKRWNVHSWPTVFLIDHEGVIRHKFIGKPEEKELNAAVEEVITGAESALKKPDKK
jgi:hypothetical protein